MSIPAEGQTLYSHTGQTSGLPVELGHQLNGLSREKTPLLSNKNDK